MGAILTLVNKVLSIFGITLQNQRDNALREDGAREAELERRDKHDAIEEKANEHRKKDNSSTDGDVINRL